MKKVIIILALFAALTLPAHATDPYEPVPGAYDGLSRQEIKELEAEREAARLIDQQVSRGGQKVMVMEATAYTWTGCRTTSGTWPSRGTVAVDPRVIPLGTELHIEGYGSAVAADTGGAIQGQKIDLYMDSEHECWQWGRRQVEVRVIEP